MAAYKEAPLFRNSSLLPTLLLLLVLILHLATGATSVIHPANALYKGDTLQAGSLLSLPPYTFVMQSDCNLVLYRDDTKPLWASQTTKSAPESCSFSLQHDGNGVIYNAAGNAVFATETGSLGDGEHFIALQDDGNARMFNADGEIIWSTD